MKNKRNFIFIFIILTLYSCGNGSDSNNSRSSNDSNPVSSASTRQITVECGDLNSINEQNCLDVASDEVIVDINIENEISNNICEEDINWSIQEDSQTIETVNGCEATFNVTITNDFTEETVIENGEDTYQEELEIIDDLNHPAFNNVLIKDDFLLLDFKSLLIHLKINFFNLETINTINGLDNIILLDSNNNIIKKVKCAGKSCVKQDRLQINGLKMASSILIKKSLIGNHFTNIKEMTIIKINN